MIDPLEAAGPATCALNVIAALRRSPAMTAAQIVTYLNSTLMPDDPADNISPFLLSYVNAGLAQAGPLVTEGVGGAFSLTTPDRYVRRVTGSTTDIELAPVGATFKQGAMW